MEVLGEDVTEGNIGFVGGAYIVLCKVILNSKLEWFHVREY
jgi:hypothetical protein